MRRWTSLVLVFGLLLATAGFHAIGFAADQGKTVTVKGEVIDTACFFAKGKRGAKHAKCAKMCVQGGVPAALLTDDGQIYILNEMHDNAEPFEQVKEHAGEVVTVKGILIEKGGVKMIFVQEVTTS